MATKKAFPSPQDARVEGMDLRDWFAGQALMAMGPEAIEALTREIDNPDQADLLCRTAARMAYRFADAMMTERG